MTTATLTQDARRNVVLYSGSGLSAAVPHTKKYFSKGSDGKTVLNLADVPVFRSGTFRDSWGEQHNWEALHIEQMVAHFNLLRERQILPHVPLRKGHISFLGQPMDTLIGYHTGLRTAEFVNPADGQPYTYLLADFEVLDPDAQQKIDSGLWRNFSSEVGTYVTNNETEFWPVYVGGAYVDIPAVEGLQIKAHTKELGQRFSLMSESEKESPVTETPTDPAAEEETPEQPTTEEPAEDGGEEGSETPETPVADAPPTPAASPVEAQETHSASGNTFTFRVNGQPELDFSRVQSHITALEGAFAETRDANRKSFVSALVSDGKVTAPQQADLEAFALGLGQEQYDSWVKTWGRATKLPLLEEHGSTKEHSSQSGGPSKDAAADALQDARDIVARHRLANMRQEQLEETSSYKLLVAAGETP